MHFERLLVSSLETLLLLLPADSPSLEHAPKERNVAVLSTDHAIGKQHLKDRQDLEDLLRRATAVLNSNLSKSSASRSAGPENMIKLVATTSP
jgi:hypothetical protein